MVAGLLVPPPFLIIKNIISIIINITTPNIIEKVIHSNPKGPLLLVHFGLSNSITIFVSSKTLLSISSLISAKSEHVTSSSNLLTFNISVPTVAPTVNLSSSSVVSFSNSTSTPFSLYTSVITFTMVSLCSSVKFSSVENPTSKFQN